MMKRIDYFIPTRIVFGAGRLKELATLSLPGKKALLCVTEDKLMEKLGIQQRVIELLGQNGVSVAVFDKVTPNPTRTGVMAAAALAKESGCDFVIGLGGGSSIDTAKAASIMMANPGDLWDYASAGSGGRKPVSGAFPVVAISTTAGTGTEADPYAVVTNEETNEKLDFTLDEIFPAISIIDPELMLTLPHKLTLFQGFDALFHASECYVNNGNENRLTELFAVDAIEKVAQAPAHRLRGRLEPRIPQQHLLRREYPVRVHAVPRVHHLPPHHRTGPRRVLPQRAARRVPAAHRRRLL